jgi:catechol 2,3-dioxygenase-like lactoylglutathione lyase family enzyme
MVVKRVVPIIKVSDIGVALDFYCATLGFLTDFKYVASPDGPTYAGVSLDGNQVHLSTFAGDGVFGTTTYCYVDDVDALYRELCQKGLKLPKTPGSPVEEGPVNQTWGMREFYVRDPDGNTLRFGSPTPHTAG